MTDHEPGAHPRDPQRRPGEKDSEYAQRVFAARSKAFGTELAARAQAEPVWEGQEWGWEPDVPPPTDAAPIAEKRREELLASIRAVGGEWTGSKVARWWNLRFNTEITRYRGDQHLFILAAHGHLVQTRPPRGRTFVLAEVAKDA
jgi:hypothetical protein